MRQNTKNQQLLHVLPCNSVKDTSYVSGKKQQNLQLLYIREGSLSRSCYFFAVFASYIASILKVLYLTCLFMHEFPIRFLKDYLLAEL